MDNNNCYDIEEYIKLYNCFLCENKLNEIKTYDEIKKNYEITKKEYKKYKKAFFNKIDENNILIQMRIKKFLEFKKLGHECLGFYNYKSLNFFNDKLYLTMPQDPAEIKWCCSGICMKSENYKEYNPEPF